MFSILKTLNGLSGDKIYLIKEQENLLVRKIGSIERNVERLNTLNAHVNVPKIFQITNNSYDMEYIQGLDIKQYLKYNKPETLTKFIVNILKKFSINHVWKDYTEVYHKKLSNFPSDVFAFSKEELIHKLPKILPKSLYHGDFTFDNMLYSESKEFYLIDPLTSEYDSWIFDLAKLRQDLECKWFLRNHNIFLDVELYTIQQNIFQQLNIEVNDYLLILMLLRIYPYTEKNSIEQTIILKEVNRLWK